MDLHGHQQPGHGPAAIQAEREGTGEKFLGAGKLGLGRAFGDEAADLLADHLHRFPRAVVAGGGIAIDQPGTVQREQRGADAVGQAPRLADLLEQPRREGAAAQNMVHHEGRKPVGVVAANTRQRKSDHGLRDRPVDHGLAEEGGLHRPGHHVTLARRQGGEGPIDHLTRALGRDVPHDPHRQPRAGELCAGIGHQIVALDGAHGFGRALVRAAIGIGREQALQQAA